MGQGFARSAIGAMVLLATAAAWGQGAKFTISGYQVEGNTLLPDAEVQQILSGFTGSDRGLEDINAAADALHKAYEKAGYPVVRVFPPEQAASGGTIRLKVVEGQVRAITVKGNQAYEEANILASLPSLRIGLAPNAPRIVAEIAMANENPAKQVAVNFQAGEQPGAVDATVNVTEDRPEKFIATFDNGGSKSTGVHRVSLGYQNANFLNRDHMVTAQVGSSTDYPQKSLNLSAGYRIPFYGYGLSLDLIAAYSDTASGTTIVPGGGTMNFTGKGTIFGARLNHPMASLGEYRHKLIYGFDYKDFNNRCQQGVTNIPAAQCGTITSQPVSVSYVAQYNTPGLQLGGSAMYAMNVPGGPHGEPGDYHTSTTNTRAHWNLWRFNAFAGVPLADWLLRANAAAQMTEFKLISGEQFGIGGASSVRGYTERALAGDEGISGSLELYTPELAGKVLLPSGYGLRGLVFYDSGRVFFNAPTANQRQQSISSVGAGLRFNVGRDLTAKLDVGVAQDRLVSQTAGVSRDRGDTYGQFAINYSF